MENNIVIDLVNLSGSSQSIDLFKMSNSIDNIIYYQTLTNPTFNIDITLEWFVNGVADSNTFSGQTSFSDFVNNANTYFSGDLVFSIETVSVSETKLFIQAINESYVVRSIDYGVYYYYFNSKTVISGSSISVETGDSLGYAELVNELVNQPYIFTKTNIYTNTISQVSQKLKITKRIASGVSFEEIDYPTVDPMQKQFAILNIKMDYSPSPVNSINYTLEANQRVTFWFYYKHKELLDYKSRLDKPNNIKVPETLNNKLNMKIENKSFTAPLFKLVNANISRKKTTLKETIKSLAEIKDSKEITNEEVYNSFDGSDFKEIQ